MIESLKVPKHIKEQSAKTAMSGPISLERKAVESVAARRALGIVVKSFSHRDVPDEKRLQARDRRVKKTLEIESELPTQ